MSAQVVDEAATDETAAPKAKKKGKSLVIVESPAKAKTINKYLGTSFVVKASMGHIRDLPKGKFGIDIEHGFEPDYTTIRGKAQGDHASCKRLAKSAPSVYLAPDLDREGEAIAWHLPESLEVPDDKRLPRRLQRDHEEGDPRGLRAARASSTWTRSTRSRRGACSTGSWATSSRPLLWKKIAQGLSAGRVQSVAVRLIVEREKEIRAFVKEEYWRVTAHFEERRARRSTPSCAASASERIEKNLDEQARARRSSRASARDPLELVEIEEQAEDAPADAALHDEPAAAEGLDACCASRRKKTMMLAQQLYEGVELPGEGSVGLITYMRTDSTRVSRRRARRSVRDADRDASTARTTCPRSPTPSPHARRRARRKRTRRSGRPTSARTPEDAAARR